MVSVLIIDAHAHVYSDDDVRYPAIATASRPPDESGSMHALETATLKNCVAGVCVVQPLSFYGWDNRFLCDVAKAGSARIAAVCSLDHESADSPAVLTRFVTEFGVRGLRTHVASNACLSCPGVEALWRTADRLGITVNVSTSGEKADQLELMLLRFPRLPIVIDHCLISKPGTNLADAVANMMRLAKFANAYAKLSFLPLGSAEEYPYRDMHEPLNRIVAAFGPERCVWGNTFPTELWSPKSSYAQNLRLFTSDLGFGTTAKACILGQTANRLWFNGKLSTSNGASVRGEDR